MEDYNYRDILESEFLSRQSSRKDFSYNAFAKYVGLTSSHFNDILKKRRGLSLKKATEICKKLDLSERMEQVFTLSVTEQHSRSQKEKDRARELLTDLKSDKTKIIEDALFKTVADWSHFAILELSRTPDFELNSFWIAKKLGITAHVAEKSLQRLVKLGLLKKENGKWSAHRGLLQTRDDIPSSSIKKHHQQILDLATHALMDQVPEDREYQATMMTISKDQLPRAKELIREFKKNFCDELTVNSPDIRKDTVYCLSNQFFALTPED
jgi:uncharacterized protein (TIGR02147 family)